MTGNPVSRSRLLTVLCIITFVGSGFSALGNLSMYLLFDAFKELFEQGALKPFMLSQEQQDMMALLLSANRLFFLFQGLLYSSAIIGAAYMWKLNKVGLHVYALAQILLIIMQEVFIPALPFPTFDLMISAVFVFLYAKQLKLIPSP